MEKQTDRTQTPAPHRVDGAKRAPKTGQITRTTSAVLTAMTDLLSEHGYRHVTIDMVIERSGVARSTIYRRWGNVAELAVAAFEASLGPNLAPPDHGDVRTDLVHLYRRFAKILNQSMWGHMLPSLIEASKSDPAFAQMLARVDRDRRSNARVILQRGVDRGELAADTNIDWMIDMLSGLLYYRFLITGGKLGERGMIEWAVDRCIGTA